MATDNSVTKNLKTNIIVITGNDETYQNLLSIIQKSGNCGELVDTTTQAITEIIKETPKASYQRHEANLICVICENKCSGYNFNVISCGSCKAFFRRNASQNVNDLRCLTNTNKCAIKFKNSRRICRRCRLEKCLTVGMKCNFIADEKLKKQRQLEENKRSTKNAVTTLAQTNFTNVSLEENEQLMNEPVAALEPQKVSNLDDTLAAELIRNSIRFVFESVFSGQINDIGKHH